MLGAIAAFIDGLNVSPQVKAELSAITPQNYTGLIDFRTTAIGWQKGCLRRGGTQGVKKRDPTRSTKEQSLWKKPGRPYPSKTPSTSISSWAIPILSRRSKDHHVAIVNTVPGAKFGLAFCEASDVCLVRHSGTDPAGLVQLAQKNALAVGAGHSFIIFMRDMSPAEHSQYHSSRTRSLPNFLRYGQPCGHFLVAQTDQGRAILGVVDGFSPKESEEKPILPDANRFSAPSATNNNERFPTPLCSSFYLSGRS